MSKGIGQNLVYIEDYYFLAHQRYFECQQQVGGTKFGLNYLSQTRAMGNCRKIFQLKTPEASHVRWKLKVKYSEDANVKDQNPKSKGLSKPQVSNHLLSEEYCTSRFLSALGEC